MPVAYPPELRQMLRASKSRNQPAAFGASDPRRGRPYFQAIGTDRPVVWDCTFTFTQAEAQYFWLWFTQDIDNGVDDFTMEIRTEFGLVEHTCHFLPDSLLPVTENGELWIYRAQIITVASGGGSGGGLIIPSSFVSGYAASFVGPIPDQIITLGSTLSLSLPSYWTGGLAPFRYELTAGSIPPAELVVNTGAGTIAGTPSVAASYTGLKFTRVESIARRLESNAFSIHVTNEAASAWNTTPLNGSWSFSNGDRSATLSSGSGVREIVGTLGRSTGKRYFEIVKTTSGTFGSLVRDDYGFTRLPSGGGTAVDGVVYRRAGVIVEDSATLGASVPALADGDVVGFAIDFSTGAVWFSVNGAWVAGGNPAAGTGATASIAAYIGATHYPGTSSESPSACSVTLNTKFSEFSTAPPAGFTSWASI